VCGKRKLGVLCISPFGIPRNMVAHNVKRAARDKIAAIARPLLAIIIRAFGGSMLFIAVFAFTISFRFLLCFVHFIFLVPPQCDHGMHLGFGDKAVANAGAARRRPAAGADHART
jgi:hypothetical protein